MPRNLVLCCDGTSNQFSQDRTNVLKLCYALEKNYETQLVYYHPGLGTRAPVGVRSAFGGAWAKLKGLALGAGLKADVADAYIFLMNHYRPDDRIYLFGFSRGAYTARVIASMLKLYGLAMPGNEALVPYAVDMMWAISQIRDEKKKDAYFLLADEFKGTLGAGPVKPHFLGVWDTVNSVGWIGSPLALPYTRHNPDIEIIRHAIAIDERRAFFRINWFEDTTSANIKQVWFPGTHCDIGGGYPERISGLSKYPLEWMAKEAVAADLLVNPNRLAEILGQKGGAFAPAKAEEPHESLVGPWKLAEYIPKARYNRKTKRTEQRMNRFRPRTLPDRPCVHDVAWLIPGYKVPKGAIKLSDMRWNASPPSVVSTVSPL